MTHGGIGTITGHGDVRCGLPPAPVGPVDPGQWYHDALQMPETRVTGWFGCVIGNGIRGGDVQLFFHDGDHLKPTLRLVLDRKDLALMTMALAQLLMTNPNLAPPNPLVDRFDPPDPVMERFHS